MVGYVDQPARFLDGNNAPLMDKAYLLGMY